MVSSLPAAPPSVEILHRNWHNEMQPMLQIQQSAGRLDPKQFVEVQRWIKEAFIAGSAATAKAIQDHAFDAAD